MFSSRVGSMRGTFPHLILAASLFGCAPDVVAREREEGKLAAVISGRLVLS